MTAEERAVAKARADAWRAKHPDAVREQRKARYEKYREAEIAAAIENRRRRRGELISSRKFDGALGAGPDEMPVFVKKGSPRLHPAPVSNWAKKKDQ